MTHFNDLTVLDYHSGPFDSSEWNCPLLAVGWLDKQYEYNTGNSSNELAARIEFLRSAMEASFFQYAFRGLHNCSLCTSEKMLPDSHINLFIPGNGCVYVSPGRIDHYLQCHSYTPPQAFIGALLKCPDPSDSEYLTALRTSNGGMTPPLES